METSKKSLHFQYVKIALTLLLGYIVNYLYDIYGSHIKEDLLPFMVIGILLGFGFLAKKFGDGTVLPSFVVLLLLGFFLKSPLLLVVSQGGLLIFLVVFFANLILGLGGVEIDRKEFIKIWIPTVSMAVIGYLISTVLFGFFGNLILQLFGVETNPNYMYLLGAILGSTDPAAIVPTLKNLVFKNKNLPNIAIAESAINDVIGSVVTFALLANITSDFGSPLRFFQTIGGGENLQTLGIEVVIGLVFGLIGAFLLRGYSKNLKKPNKEEQGYEVGFILFVFVACYFFATQFHGAGFLASFIAGLIAEYSFHGEQYHKTAMQIESKIDWLAKPVIFMLLGPMVDLEKLWQYAPLGITCALAFILLCRVPSVVISIGISNLSKQKLTMKEMFFFFLVRETGVIPIVLLIAAAQKVQVDWMMPVAVWIVLITLIVLPIMTPWWSKKLQLVETSKA